MDLEQEERRRKQAAQDAKDQAQYERIARMGMNLVEAFLAGRAAIVVTREPTGDEAVISGMPIHATVIRLRLDKEPGDGTA